jgi:hypothetical protein
MITPHCLKIVTAASTFALLGLNPPIHADTDLPLDNPGFEDGMDGWTTWQDRGMSQAIPDAAHSGKLGLRINDTDASGEGGNIANRKFPAIPGRTYDLKCWFRAVSGTGGAIYIKFWDANEQEIPGGNQAASDSPTWTQLEVKAVAPPNAAEVSIWIHTGNHFVTTVDYDDFTFTQIDPPAAATPATTNAVPAAH